MVITGPLEHTIGFWKPSLDASELQELAFYRDPGERPSRGINVWRSDSEPRLFRVVEGDAEFSLFAAVHPIEEVPGSAEIVADIVDRSGKHYSYVLWFPEDGSVVVPFDPKAAVQALWREEYVPPAKRTVLPQPILSAYYAAKPLLSAGVKKHLRGLMASRAQASEHPLDWPCDSSLDLLQRFLLRLILLASDRQEVRFAWFWPDRHSWAVALTHDVETAEGLANVPHVAEIESQRGLRSSFNLVPMDYEIPGSLLRTLRDEGFEIGIHGYTHDGLLFSRWSTFLQRVITINECGRRWGAAGFRSPATYRNQEWFHLLDLEYDSSVSNSAPFEPQPGGCASFFPFAVGDMIELPITLPQDHTLFGLLNQTDMETWSTCLQRIRDASGMVCVLGHPDPARGYIGLPENEAHYAQLLDTVAGSDAWVPLPRELARWWRARLLASPEQVGDIEGVSFGIAALDPSGRLQVVPPAR